MARYTSATGHADVRVTNRVTGADGPTHTAESGRSLRYFESSVRPAFRLS
jgi:hypothetical protein